MNTVGIFGTSGMAREAGDIVRALNKSPIYIARNDADAAEISPFENWILEADISSHSFTSCVIGVGNSHVRKKIADRYAGIIQFGNAIHPSCSFGHGQLDKLLARRGLIVAAGARLTNHIEVGDFCLINQGALVAHDVKLGRFVHLAPGSIVSGNVTIEDGCWIGAGAIINQGDHKTPLHIGANTVIGSGAVVTRSCERNSVYAGVPARKIR